MLLNVGANPNSKNIDEFTPIMKLYSKNIKNVEEIFDMLLKAGANFDLKNYKMQNAIFKNDDLVRQLVKYGNNLKIKNDDYFSILQLICIHSSDVIFEEVINSINYNDIAKCIEEICFHRSETHIRYVFDKFEWASFFRSKEILKCNFKINFISAKRKALKISRSKEASKLPGFKGRAIRAPTKSSQKYFTAKTHL